MSILRVAVLSSLALFSCGLVWAESPVYIPDPNLKAAIEDELWVSDPTASDMLGLVSLSATFLHIEDLTGLEYAANLEVLDVKHNRIRDVLPLSGLSHLTMLVLNNNAIADLSPLSGLTQLKHLDVHDNNVSDISPLVSLTRLQALCLHCDNITDLSPLSDMFDLKYLSLDYNLHLCDLTPLSGLVQLETLLVPFCNISDLSPLSSMVSLHMIDLHQNKVEDLSPLLGLTSVETLDVTANPLSVETRTVHIPQIRANNPGVRLDYDKHRVVVSSATGGYVTRPGEGQFSYGDGQSVTLEAVAKEGFTFITWSGTYHDTKNPVTIEVTTDLTIQACFVSTLSTLYVDDDASSFSDPLENGAPEHPFDTIQEALDVARDGATVFVRPGIYRENLSLRDRRVHLSGLDQRAPGTTAYPVLDGANTGPVLTFADCQDANCTVEGFVLTRGHNSQAGAILCTRSSPIFSHCLIAGNRSYPSGAAVLGTDSVITFLNCTLADNDAGSDGATLRLINSRLTLTNSILWGNEPNVIASDATSLTSIRYCDITGGGPLGGAGNLNTDPRFVQPGGWVDASKPTVSVQPATVNAVWLMGDYHLKSQASRWDAVVGAWVVDSITSPCVDAGDPAYSVGQEPAPNGGRLNLGAYGGTAQASKSLSTGP